MASHWATFPVRSCLECGGPTSRFTTMDNNPNGNGGRPYYLCDECGAFSSFGDTRGIHDDNPECHCGLPSRVQMAGAGPRQQIPRSLYFRCAVGGCRFFSYALSTAGEILIYPRPIRTPEQMAGMGL